MADLLFLSQRIPYPPNKGDKVRAYHMLKHLASRYDVHLGCFVDDPDDWRHVDTLREMCADVAVERLNPTWAKVGSLRGLVTGEALSLPYFRSAKLARWVDGKLQSGSMSGVFAYSSTAAQYVLGHDLSGIPFVQDFVDVDSDKWRQYAERKSGLARWIYGRESRKLLAYERQVAAAADASLLVSEAEAALFRSLVPDHAAKIHGISNGIDLEFFAPEKVTDNPYADLAGPVIVFTGAMNYWPNVDAVRWFAEQVFSAIRERYPDAVFFIVGANPTPEVEALAQGPAVRVTGRVRDIRPFIKGADLCVAPMQVARGIQNKVLEAMALARPMVTTPQGHEGISATPGRDLEVADGREAFIAACLACLATDRGAAIGTAARALVQARYAWEPNLRRLDAFLAGG